MYDVLQALVGWALMEIPLNVWLFRAKPKLHAAEVFAPNKVSPLRY